VAIFAQIGKISPFHDFLERAPGKSFTRWADFHALWLKRREYAQRRSFWIPSQNDG